MTLRNCLKKILTNITIKIQVKNDESISLTLQDNYVLTTNMNKEEERNNCKQTCVCMYRQLMLYKNPIPSLSMFMSAKESLR